MNPDLDNLNSAQLDLSQLRDIHMPASISMWPPAPGWWMLLGLMLLAVAGYWLVRRFRQRNAWRRDALAQLATLHKQYELEELPAHNVVSELSVLLRRIAVSCFPREASASLSGDEWLAFLERQSNKGASFQAKLGRLLIVVPYAHTTIISPEEMNSLLEFCREWITKLPTGGRL